MNIKVLTQFQEQKCSVNATCSVVTVLSYINSFNCAAAQVKVVYYPLKQKSLAGLISSNSGYVSYRLVTIMSQHFPFPLLLSNLNFPPLPPSSDTDDHDSDADI